MWTAEGLNDYLQTLYALYLNTDSNHTDHIVGTAFQSTCCSGLMQM